MSETFNDIPGGTRNQIGIRIIFTKIISNKVLIGGMAAGIYIMPEMNIIQGSFVLK